MPSPFRLGFEPFDRLNRLQEELERALEAPRLHGDRWVSGRGVFPAVNVFSSQAGYVVRLEVPGMSPEQLQIEAQGNTLRISGKRETAAASKGSVHRHERWSGEFSRSLQLPQDLDLAKAEATYRSGILTLRVPLREEAKPRQISVSAA